MAELATIARPYAEALFKAIPAQELGAVATQMDALSVVASDASLRAFADNPKALPDQVFGLVTQVVGLPLGEGTANLLRAVIENGRLSALPAIAAQFQTLVHAQSGVSQATVFSAYPIGEAQVAEVSAALEKRFGRKLELDVQIDPTLIGGIRAVVGDEVLDTSVKARLEQMKVALTA